MKKGTKTAQDLAIEVMRSLTTKSRHPHADKSVYYNDRDVAAEIHETVLGGLHNEREEREKGLRKHNARVKQLAKTWHPIAKRIYLENLAKDTKARKTQPVLAEEDIRPELMRALTAAGYTYEDVPQEDTIVRYLKSRRLKNKRKAK